MVSKNETIENLDFGGIIQSFFEFISSERFNFEKCCRFLSFHQNLWLREAISCCGDANLKKRLAKEVRKFHEKIKTQAFREKIENIFSTLKNKKRNEICLFLSKIFVGFLYENFRIEARVLVDESRGAYMVRFENRDIKVWDEWLNFCS